MSEKTAVYQSFYTKSDAIVNYMINLLSIESDMKVLEPCAGDGAFVDALLKTNDDLKIELFEINPDAFSVLCSKYQKLSHISIIEQDFLSNTKSMPLFSSYGPYDRVIGNPPYGGWQNSEKRKFLKKLYPGFYVKETYALFIIRAIQLLRNNGILVFIVPDTFLNLHMHTSLRKFLLTRTKILEIALFPSAFFPGVNFGYSNLSIIALQKATNEKDCLEHEIKVLSGFKTVEDLVTNARQLDVYRFKQKDILQNSEHALYISKVPKVTWLINNCSMHIGDVADCVTGFYSGDDKMYLRVASKQIRNSSRYQVINQNLVKDEWENMVSQQEGIDDEQCYIPIVKGGMVKYLKPDHWFMEWSKESVNYYKKDKKARFQNSQYYFKQGIAVPMVSSSQISGTLLNKRLFDQSIVGVFPKDEKLLFYLLALFNSPTCNKLIRTINPTANNSANYLKKIPFIKPSQAMLDEIGRVVNSIIEKLNIYGKVDIPLENEANNLISKVYGF